MTGLTPVVGDLQEAAGAAGRLAASQLGFEERQLLVAAQLRVLVVEHPSELVTQLGKVELPVVTRGLPVELVFARRPEGAYQKAGLAEKAELHDLAGRGRILRGAGGCVGRLRRVVSNPIRVHEEIGDGKRVVECLSVELREVSREANGNVVEQSTVGELRLIERVTLRADQVRVGLFRLVDRFRLIRVRIESRQYSSRLRPNAVGKALVVAAASMTRSSEMEKGASLR